MNYNKEEECQNTELNLLLFAVAFFKTEKTGNKIYCVNVCFKMDLISLRQVHANHRISPDTFFISHPHFAMSVALPMLIWITMMTCYICTQTYSNATFMAPTNINKIKNIFSHLPQRLIYRL